MQVISYLFHHFLSQPLQNSTVISYKILNLYFKRDKKRDKAAGQDSSGKAVQSKRKGKIFSSQQTLEE